MCFLGDDDLLAGQRHVDGFILEVGTGGSALVDLVSRNALDHEVLVAHLHWLVDDLGAHDLAQTHGTRVDGALAYLDLFLGERDLDVVTLGRIAVLRGSRGLGSGVRRQCGRSGCGCATFSAVRVACDVRRGGLGSVALHAVVAVDLGFFFVGDGGVGVDGRRALHEVALVGEVDGAVRFVHLGLLDGNHMVVAEEPTGFDADKLQVAAVRVGPQAVDRADFAAGSIDYLVVEQRLDGVGGERIKGVHSGLVAGVGRQEVAREERCSPRFG